MKGHFVPHSEETKKRLSEILTGIKRSPETILKMKGRTPHNKGKHLSEEQKQNLSKIFKGKKMPPRSMEWCENISKAKRGSGSNFWRGGLTSINFAIRNSREYKLWKIAVHQRDNHKCIWCGRGQWDKKLHKRIKLHADHIKPFALYPELRFAIDNGRTLCEDCHKKTDTYAGNSKCGHKQRLMIER